MERSAAGGLTFCCRHSLHARFTPGCLLLSLLASRASSALPGEESPSRSLRFLPLVLVGLVKAVLVEVLPTLPPLLWFRPKEAVGSALIGIEA